MTQVIVAPPPNMAAILKVFPMAASKGVMFAWAGTIFSPDSAYVPPQLIAHEEVHFEQQADIGGPEVWWDRYLESPEFRLQQELKAHIIEYATFCDTTRNRAMKRGYLDQVAKRLSGPLYANLMSYDEAMFVIRNGA